MEVPCDRDATGSTRTRYAGGAIGATGVAPGAPAAASGLGSTTTTPTAHRPRASTSRGRETTAGAADAAEDVDGTTTTAAAASDHQRDAAITHARGTTAAAAVSGARAAAVEATGRRRALAIGTAATDTHREQRARHDGHGRRGPTAHATRGGEFLRPAPFAARRACGVNGDRDDAGGHSKELIAAGIG